MRVILQPTVTVVAQTKFLGHPVYKVPADGTEIEQLGAFAAKGCYDSYGENGRANKENQRRIIEAKHGSVLEHSSVSLFIEGITRGLSLELNRHRPFAISQRSTRYTKEEDAAIVLEPGYAELYVKHEADFSATGGFRAKPAVTERDRLEQSMLANYLMDAQDTFISYRRQVDYWMELNPEGLEGFALRKFARGKARNRLPHDLETRGTWTSNFRLLRHFLEVRSSRHAEAEIRRLANAMLAAASPLAPTYFEDYKGSQVAGQTEWTTQYEKV